MSAVTANEGKGTRPGGGCDQRVSLVKPSLSIFCQEAGEAVGDRLIDRDQPMFLEELLDPAPLCRRKTRFREQLFFGDDGVVDAVSRGVEDLFEALDAVEVIDEDIRVRQERRGAPRHLRVLGHVLQERLRGAAILVSQRINIPAAWNGLWLPHPEPPLLWRKCLRKVAIHDILRDAVLLPDADGGDFSAANEVSDSFGRELKDLCELLDCIDVPVGNSLFHKFPHLQNLHYL